MALICPKTRTIVTLETNRVRGDRRNHTNSVGVIRWVAVSGLYVNSTYKIADQLFSSVQRSKRDFPFGKMSGNGRFLRGI